MDIEFVRSRFIKHFDGSTGSVYASPGRINLIGEHTDYNGGFVFPGAIDKGMVAELKINGTDKVRAYSIDLKDAEKVGKIRGWIYSVHVGSWGGMLTRLLTFIAALIGATP